MFVIFPCCNLYILGPARTHTDTAPRWEQPTLAAIAYHIAPSTAAADSLSTSKCLHPLKQVSTPPAATLPGAFDQRPFARRCSCANAPTCQDPPLTCCFPSAFCSFLPDISTRLALSRTCSHVCLHPLSGNASQPRTIVMLHAQLHSWGSHTVCCCCSKGSLLLFI